MFFFYIHVKCLLCLSWHDDLCHGFSTTILYHAVKILVPNVRISQLDINAILCFLKHSRDRLKFLPHTPDDEILQQHSKYVRKITYGHLNEL